jgi:hypothetical protein
MHPMSYLRGGGLIGNTGNIGKSVLSLAVGALSHHDSQVGKCLYCLNAYNRELLALPRCAVTSPSQAYSVYPSAEDDPASRKGGHEARAFLDHMVNPKPKVSAEII